jgi:hypothetical protein
MAKKLTADILRSMKLSDEEIVSKHILQDIINNSEKGIFYLVHNIGSKSSIRPINKDSFDPSWNPFSEIPSSLHSTKYDIIEQFNKEMEDLNIFADKVINEIKKHLEDVSIYTVYTFYSNCAREASSRWADSAYNSPIETSSKINCNIENYFKDKIYANSMDINKIKDILFKQDNLYSSSIYIYDEISVNICIDWNNK